MVKKIDVIPQGILTNIKSGVGVGGKDALNIKVNHDTLGEITVISKYSRDDLIKKMNFYKSKEMVDKGYVRFFADPMEKVSREDVVKEINDKIVVLNDVLDKKSLYFFLEDIVVKKNGKFRKNSVVKLFDLTNCCRFSQKNYQWLVPRVQLKAIDENTVELEFEERWDDGMSGKW